MEHKYNMRSPAVKRLMREAIELRSPTTMYFAQPLEENLFEWHFTIRGPEGTAFEGGLYHGRVILPSEYPMKPPSIILLTPNGRFELHQKICLSASSYHPELWQPSWSIRTVLLAIIGFMPTEGVGAIGAMDCSPEQRRKMAARSQDWTCSVCGTPNRIHLLAEEESSSQQKTMEEAASIVSEMTFQSEAEVQQRKKALSQVKKPLTPSEATPPPSSPPSLSPTNAPVSESTPTHPPSNDDETRPVAAENVGGASGELRRRGGEGGGGGGYPQIRLSRASPVLATDAAQGSRVRGSALSLLLVWILILCIAGLVARRLVMTLL